MAAIELDAVTKRFPDGTVAVNEMSLEVEDGEFMILVGPSGCGKTTALRMVAGLEEVTDGEIRIGGQVVNDVEPGDRDVAMVFQNYALYPHMTVRENIAFPLQDAEAPAPGDRPARGRGCEAARARRAAAPQAARALGRPAPAGRDGSRDRAASAGVPDGRAALEPRREAAGPDARRAGEAPPAARRDDALRDARPDRGDDARAARRRPAARRDPAGRRATAALPPSGQHVRRELHRLARR